MIEQIERMEHEFDFFEHESLKSLESHPAGFLIGTGDKDSVDS